MPELAPSPSSSPLVLPQPGSSSCSCQPAPPLFLPLPQPTEVTPGYASRNSPAQERAGSCTHYSYCLLLLLLGLANLELVQDLALSEGT